MEKEKKLYILALLVMVGFFFAILFCYYEGIYQGQPYPYNTFLFKPADRYMDFYTNLAANSKLNPYFGENFLQYPFLGMICWVFSLIPRPYTYFLYLLIVISLSIYFIYQLLWQMPWYKKTLFIFILFFLSYPVLFSIDRGNFEFLLFVALLASLYFYIKQDYLISAICLALAIAMKIYPALFLLLFIADKKYREAILAIGIAVLLTLVSLLFFQGGLIANFLYLLSMSNINTNKYIVNYINLTAKNSVQRGVTLLTLIKIIIIELRLNPSPFMVENFSTIYSVLSAIIAIPLAIYTIFFEKEMWKKVALIIFAMLLLPSVSADYKLLLVYLPLVLFLNAEGEGKLDPVYTILFALLLIPITYYFLPTVVSENKIHEISIGVVIRIVGMLVFCLVIIGSGIWKRKHLVKKTLAQ